MCQTSVSLGGPLERESEEAGEAAEAAWGRCADMGVSAFDPAVIAGAGAGAEEYPGGRSADGRGGGGGGGGRGGGGGCPVRPALDCAKCDLAEAAAAARVPGTASTAGAGAVGERACGAVPLRSGTLEEAWPGVDAVGVLGVLGPGLICEGGTPPRTEVVVETDGGGAGYGVGCSRFGVGFSSSGTFSLPGGRRAFIT